MFTVYRLNKIARGFPFLQRRLRYTGCNRISHTSNGRCIRTFQRHRQQQQQSTSTRTRNNPNYNNDSTLFQRIPPYIWLTAGSSTFLIGYVYYTNLDEVPLTKRRRWIATTPQREKQLGDNEYQKLIQQFHDNILPPDHRASQTLLRVGQRIAKASYQFAQQHDAISSLSNDNGKTMIPFTYTVVKSDIANAFVLPGNHIFLMTGLLKFVQNEDELAIILGHEMAHNIARHAGEKISGSILVSIIARLSLLLDPSGLTLAILLPTATLFRELPNSRVQEIEADQIGLHIAAEACYDPRASKRVFLAMMKDEEDIDHHHHGSASQQQKQQHQQPPELLSTHPSYDTRISNFDKWIPDAMQRYQSDMGERCKPIRQQMKLARQIAAQQALRREDESRRK